MGNMSYCRFQNTLQDLRDCYEALQGGESLSQDEKQAQQMLVQLCTRISGEFSMGTDIGAAVDYDDNSLSPEDFAAYCKFENACEDSDYEPMAFHLTKLDLQGMGYEGVELYETLAKLVDRPGIKQAVDTGTIADRADLIAQRVGHAIENTVRTIPPDPGDTACSQCLPEKNRERISILVASE